LKLKQKEKDKKEFLYYKLILYFNYNYIASKNWVSINSLGKSKKEFVNYKLNLHFDDYL